MNNFLSNISKRHFGELPTVNPRQKSLFESDSYEPTSNTFEEDNEDGNLLPLSTDKPHNNPVNQTDSNNNQHLNKIEHTEVQKNETINLVQSQQFKPPSLPNIQPKDTQTENTSESTLSPFPTKKELLNATSNDPQVTQTPLSRDENRETNSKKNNAPTNRKLPEYFSEPKLQVANQKNLNDSSYQFEKKEKPVTNSPTVKINIGRIEIKSNDKSKATRPKRTPNKPNMTLDQYLKKREA